MSILLSPIFFVFIVIGCLVGFMAGLLGIGGGSMVVPIINYIAETQNFSDSIIMKLSLGTSFSIIIMSTASSAWSHNKHGTILWPKVPFLGTGAVIGVLVGGSIVNLLSNTYLQVIFCVFLSYTIYTLLFPKKSNVKNDLVPQHASYIFIIVGLIIGFLSSFIGIAGGAITVPFLTHLGFDIRRSIATSAMIGVVLSIFGTISYIYNGWGNPDLPEYSLGYIYLPAFIGIAFMSIFFAPLGVKLSYKLPVKLIRQIFAGFLAIVLVKMLFSLF